MTDATYSADSAENITESALHPTCVYIFFNPNSGSRQGLQLKAYAASSMRLKELSAGRQCTTFTDVQVRIYDLTDEPDLCQGLNVLLTDWSSGCRKIIVCSAGGDGSFSSLLTCVIHRGISLNDRLRPIYFTVFGLGTGNDLPQNLGWSKTIPRKDTASFGRFCKHIRQRLHGAPMDLDIWKVTVTPRASGRILKAGQHANVATVQRQHVNVAAVSMYMSNYVTFGLQGAVGYRFESHRKRWRALNVCEYGRQSFLKGSLGRIERVSDYAIALHHAGVRYPLDANVHPMMDRSVELVFQNVPGIWGRKRELWNECRPGKIRPFACSSSGGLTSNGLTSSDMADGKLDAFVIRSRADYFVKQMKCLAKWTRLDRLGQFPDHVIIECAPRASFHMMVDGEFFLLQDIQDICIERFTRIPVLTGLKKR